MGLLDFTTYNSISKVVQGKNNEFPVQMGDTWKIITLPTGTYEIDDFEAYLNQLADNEITLRLKKTRYNVN